MRLVIAVFALICAFACVTSVPLTRIAADNPIEQVVVDRSLERDVSLNEIKDGLETILKALQDKIATNIISAPTYCDEGYKMYNGQCRRVFFYVPNIRQRP